MKKHTRPIRLAIFHEHVIAFVLACFLVVWLLGIFVYRGALFADLTQAWGNSVSQAPLLYAVRDGSLQISTKKSFVWVTSISFFIAFDPQKVLLQLSKATSPYSYTYAPSGETMVQVTLFVKWDMQAWTIYTIPVNGSIEDVTLTNASVSWQTDAYEWLAVQKQ